MTAPGWTPEPRLFEPLHQRLRRGAGELAALARLRDAHVRAADPVLRAFVEWRPSAGEVRPLSATFKDLIDVAGFSTRAGSRWFRRYPGRSARIARLVAAVAGVDGKVETSEFGVGTTVSAVNPWYPEYSPGGSSSGSAVAVAAGLCDVSVGTDTIASVRHPAACCGVVGLRLTPRRSLLDGVLGVAPTLDAVGVLARSAQDLAVLWSRLGPRNAGGTRGVPAADVRLRRVTDWEAGPVDPAVAATWARVMDTLAAAGAAPVARAVPWWRFREHVWPLVLRECADLHRPRAGEHDAGSSPDVRRVLALGAEVSDAEYRALRADQRRAQSEAAASFEDVDVLLLPADPYAARRLSDPPPDSVVPGSEAAAGLGFMEAAAFPRLPALVLPVGSARGGAPLALQLLARRGGEGALVTAACRIERALSATMPAEIPG